MQNVRDVVDKYAGNLDIAYTDDRFTVTVLIGNRVCEKFSVISDLL